MKTQVIFVLITLISTRLVSTSPFMIRRDGGFIHLPIAVHYYCSNNSYPNGTMNSTNPNAAPVPVSIRNDLFSYEVQLGIGGDPIQYLTLQLDTGSSDIWVYGPGSCTICQGGICE